MNTFYLLNFPISRMPSFFRTTFSRIQAALVIRGFGIRGFDYSRFNICYQILVFADFFIFSLDYSRF